MKSAIYHVIAATVTALLLVGCSGVEDSQKPAPANQGSTDVGSPSSPSPTANATNGGTQQQDKETPKETAIADKPGTGVPEPGTGILGLLSAALFLGRRRR